MTSWHQVWIKRSVFAQLKQLREQYKEDEGVKSYGDIIQGLINFAKEKGVIHSLADKHKIITVKGGVQSMNEGANE